MSGKRSSGTGVDRTSIADHQLHLRAHLQQVRETGRPLYVTSEGAPEAVVLSLAAYDSLAERAALADSLALLDRGMEDMAAGRGRPLDEAVHEIANRLGLNLEG